MRANLGSGATGVPLFGGIEADGTKLVCAVSTNPARGTLARTRFSTGDDPSALLAQVCEWFSEQERQQGPLTCVVSPQRIVLGGSVRRAGQLGGAEFFRRMRAELARAPGGYIESPALCDRGLDGFLVPPELGDDAGVLGALALAQDARLQTAPPR